MPVDPTIALQVKPLQLPDPLAQYGNFMAVQRAQQQNALAQMQMEQAQREVVQQNNLRQFLPTMRPEDRQQLLGYGEAGRQVYESLLKGEKETREAEKAAADVAAARMKQSRDLLPSVMKSPNPQTAYTNWRAYTLKNLPGLANLIPEQYTPEGVRGLMKEADKELEQHFVTQDLNGGKQVLSMPKYGGGPAAVVPGSVAQTLPLPPNVEAQKKRIALAGRPSTTVVLTSQEKAFESELGKGQAERLIKGQTAAQDAASIIDTVNTGRQIMRSGMITGAGAEFFVALNQALKTAGIDAGQADAAANSQAFAANMAGNVGRIIKQFGAGTGLSNADREYAEKMAGGKITLDASAINRILDINESAARNVIRAHNKNVKDIKTNIPLTVEEPPETRSAKTSAPPQTPMFARNPQTGERIMSVDGGNTWAPAR